MNQKERLPSGSLSFYLESGTVVTKYLTGEINIMVGQAGNPNPVNIRGALQ
jgi:hypothetical protein